MTRTLRIAALLVILLCGFQIAMCAAGCDCFLLAGTRMSHASSPGDADGCLCCTQSAEVRIAIEIPGPLPERLVLFDRAHQRPQYEATLIDLPPRS